MAHTLPGFEIDTWWGLVAPNNVPLETVKKLNTSFVAALQTPSVKARFDKLMAEPTPTDAEAFGVFMQNERSKYQKIVKLSGAKID